MKSTNSSVKANLQFMKYGVTHAKEKSGAYLFLPDADAQVLQRSSLDEGNVDNILCIFRSL